MKNRYRRKLFSFPIHILILFALVFIAINPAPALADVPPDVSTVSAANISFDGATLNGFLNSLGTGTSANVSFDYGLTPGYGSSTASQPLSANVSFSQNITGLNPGTFYHFRAKADGGSHGQSVGSDMSFTTLAPLITNSASNIKTNAVTLNGALLFKGSAGSVTLLFKYAPDDYYSLNNQNYSDVTPTITQASTGNFSSTISGLRPGIKYHFKAVSANNSWEGADMTFNTSTMDPVVVTLPASSIGRNSAYLNGNLVDIGTVISANVSFDYGITDNYGESTIAQPLSTGGFFSANPVDLVPGTIYHFRAVAQWGANSIYGIDLTFPTLPIPPVVQTNPATNVADYSATLNGNLASLGAAGSVNVYFQYGTSTGYASRTAYSNKSATGNFSTDLTGLKGGTLYHFRAVADDSTGNPAYGVDMTFSTITRPPEVDTGNTTVISSYTATLNGVLNSLGTATAVNLFFAYGVDTSYGNTTTIQHYSAAGSFSADISGLSSNTTYHVRAVADGGIHGIANGNDMTFTTPNVTAPQVITLAPSAVSYNVATLNGNLTSLGTATSANVSFEYGLTSNPSYTGNTTAQTLSATGNFSYNLSGLKAGTTYHFRARADGGNSGTANGTDLTFTTLAVVTDVASNVKTNSATLNGRLLDTGAAGPFTLFFRYAPEPYYLSHGLSYSDNTPTITMTSTGNFSSSIGNLSPGTTYHFKAVSANNSWEGQDVFFTTRTMDPVVVTLPASDIGRNSAVLKGNLIDIGTDISVNVFFQFGLTDSYGATSTLTPFTSSGQFNTTINNLSPGTTYHFRAFAQSGLKLFSGIDLTFTTLPIPPVIQTNPATNAADYSATLNGNLASLGNASSVNVYFQFGTSTGYTGNTTFTSTSAIGNFSANITDLQPGTLYHFRAVADDLSSSLVYGVDMAFTTTTQPPKIDTQVATPISFTTATLNGVLTSMGTASTVNLYFEYGTDTFYGNTSTIQAASTASSFYANLSGLSPGAIYHFRAVADGAAHGKAYADDMTFTTLGVAAPQVITSAASAVGYDVARLNGRLNSMGTASTANVSFEYGLNQTYGHTSSEQLLAATGNFSFNISGLAPATTYHFRAKALSQVHGTTFGDDLTFTTLNATSPRVSTLSANNTSYNSAVLNGKLDSLGTASSSNVFFEYGPTQAHGFTTTIQTLSTNTTFNFNVINLSPATTYYFRARADGGNHGSANGSDMSFATLATTPPEVSTNSAVNIGFDTATLTGHLDSLGSAASANVSFQYGTTIPFGLNSVVRSLSATGNFSITVNGLTPFTTYYFRAIANAGIHGTANGTDMTFFTQNVTAPLVSTDTAVNISFNSATLSGRLLSQGTANTTYVSFDYGLTPDYGSTTATQQLSSNVSFNQSLAGLNPGTIYHFRARADGGVHGQTTGADMTFTTLTPPTVSTGTAENITFSSVRLSGNLMSLGTASNIMVFFEYGTSSGYGSTTAIQSVTSMGNGAFSANLSGLSANTTYHFRARADAGINGTGSGSDMTFITLTPPALSADSASDITYTAANVNGYLSSLGTSTTVFVSFEYGLTSNYGSKTAIQTMTVPGPFNAYISGLAPGNIYHFRATADGGISGTTSGTDATFTTLSVSPIVSSAPASDIATTSATLNGNLSSLGTAVIASVYFEYGPNTNYGFITNNQTMTSPGLFHVNLSNLNPSTLYYFHAVASDAINLPSAGDNMTFTTLNVIPPGISTVSASDISYGSVVLNARLDTLGTAGNVNLSFAYGLTQSYGLSTTNQTLSSNTTFSIMLSGLTPSTSYHFKALVDGGIHGSASGSDMSFTTLTPIPPTVSTNSAANISFDTATLNGQLVSLGTASSANVSFDYGLTPAYGNTTGFLPLSTNGSFSRNLSGLTPGKPYHFRARADGGIHGQASGLDMTFTTLPVIAPTVSTLPAIDISSDRATLNGLLILLGTAPSANVSFDYGVTAAYGNTTSSQPLSSNVSFSQSLTGLTAGTLYYFRARANGDIHGSATGVSANFTTAYLDTTPPAVNTLAAGAINSTSTVLSGNLTSKGSASSLVVYFEYGTTLAYGNFSANQTLNDTGIFSSNITGLVPGTTYHFRASADGGIVHGTSSGADVIFTTAYLLPSVDTLAASSITPTSAILSGNLTSLGTANSIKVAFEYGPSTAYGNITEWQTLTTTGNFTFNLVNLDPGTIYHFRADADGGISGNATGPDLTFTTLSVTAPTVSTTSASNISSNITTLNGFLNSLGTAATVNVSFEYGLSQAYGNTTASQTLSANVSFIFNLSGLSENTTYHFRARADGGIHGAASGSDTSFTTAAAGTSPPAVATLAAAGITPFSASLSGNLSSLGTAASVNVNFDYGLTTAYGSSTASQTLNTTGPFNLTVANLTPATTYHFRANAYGDVNGTASGPDLTFITTSPASGGGGGGGGGGGSSSPAIPTIPPTPVSTNATGTLDTSGIISKDGHFNSSATLQSTDGKAIITLAKGTLGINTDGSVINLITVTQISPSALPSPPAGMKIISWGYNFEPSGCFFDPAIPITIGYDSGSLDPGAALSIFYYDSNQRQWLKLTDSTVDFSNNRLMAQTNHFTAFAVLAQPPEVPALTPTPSPAASQPASPTPTQAAPPSSSPVSTPAASPTPGVAPAPVLTPSPTLPQASGTPPAEDQSNNTFWIVLIVVLAVILVFALIYLQVLSRRKAAATTERTATSNLDQIQAAGGSQGTGNYPSTTLYYGTIKLLVQSPVTPGQLQELESFLRQSTDLQFNSINETSGENSIVISIDKRKPIFLINILKAMPPVKQVTIKNSQIVITL